MYSFLQLCYIRVEHLRDIGATELAIISIFINLNLIFHSDYIVFFVYELACTPVFTSLCLITEQIVCHRIQHHLSSLELVKYILDNMLHATVNIT